MGSGLVGEAPPRPQLGGIKVSDGTSQHTPGLVFLLLLDNSVIQRLGNITVLLGPLGPRLPFRHSRDLAPRLERHGYLTTLEYSTVRVRVSL